MSLSFISKTLLLFLFSVHIMANTISIDALAKQASQEDKQLLIFFHKLGCGYCEKMVNKTFRNDIVAKEIKKDFIFVDIGIEDMGYIIHKDFRGTKYDYAKSLDIGLYPTVGFVDEKSSYIHAVIGYRSTKSFLTHLQYIKSEKYKEMDFEGFKSYLDFKED